MRRKYWLSAEMVRWVWEMDDILLHRAQFAGVGVRDGNIVSYGVKVSWCEGNLVEVETRWIRFVLVDAFVLFFFTSRLA